jgi:hypothetical protein
MISIQPTEVLEPGKWVEHIDQGILIMAGARTCPHGVIVYWACGLVKGLLAWCMTIGPGGPIVIGMPGTVGDKHAEGLELLSLPDTSLLME